VADCGTLINFGVWIASCLILSMLNQMGEQRMNPEWLIWSREHGAWWCPESSGYTRNLDQAGRYSLEQATEICEHANRYSDRIQETMFPCQDQKTSTRR
jgi:hypothetical protein